jgi:TRAP-type C4-dicarboxylate transport system substrate-binding protein
MRSLSICALGVVLATLAFATASAQPVVLKFANSTQITDRYTAWIDKVHADAGGAIEIQLFGRDTPLGKGSRPQLGHLRDGSADIAVIVTSQFPRDFPDDDLTELPYLFADAGEGSVAMKRLADQGLIRGYEEFRVIGAWTDADRWLHTNFPLPSLGELRGKTIRVPGEFTTPIVDSLGARTVAMSPVKTPPAFAAGNLDGIFNIMRGMYSRGIMDSVSYHLDAPMGRAFLAVLMSKATYDSLPDAAKAAIDKHSGEALSRSWGDALEAEHWGLVERLRASPGHTIRTITAAEKAELEAASQVGIQNWIALDPRRALALEAARREVAKLRAGG